MLDVKNICCCFLCVIVGLTTVDKLEVFYINFCCFSNKNVSFLALNDAMASSPWGGATIDSWMRILKGWPRLHISVSETKRLSCTVPNDFNFYRKSIWCHSAFSARGRYFGYIFWKGDPVFIWCLLVTLRLPCTVCDIIRCYFQP